MMSENSDCTELGHIKFFCGCGMNVSPRCLENGKLNNLNTLQTLYITK